MLGVGCLQQPSAPSVLDRTVSKQLLAQVDFSSWVAESLTISLALLIREEKIPDKGGDSMPESVKDGSESSESQYQKIIEICRKSQQIMDKRPREIIKKASSELSSPLVSFEEALGKALEESEPYESMWEEYSKQITKSVELRHKDFSGLLFKSARFGNHNFIDCDFSGSRWFFSLIAESNCAGSNFSGISSLICPFKNTDCTNCNFTDAEINFFDPLESNNYENANFNNAKLNTSHSFFKGKKPPPQANFKNAIMNGCRLTIKREERPEHNTTKEELKSILDKIFSPSQLQVMHIDYGTSGCFIATAACGIDSEEAIILRHFRDTVLLNSALGRLFVRTYYRLSPPIASLIANSPKAKCVVRNVMVRPWARLASRIGPVWIKFEHQLKAIH